MEFNDKQNGIDYQDLFIVGICAIGAGSVFATISILTFVGMMSIGLCLMAIGLAKRDNWKSK